MPRIPLSDEYDPLEDTYDDEEFGEWFADEWEDSLDDEAFDGIEDEFVP